MTVNCDILIIGGGIGGLTAANQAAQAGLRVCLLEAGETPDYLCNSRVTGGVFHVAYRSVMHPADTLAEAIDKQTLGHSDRGLVDLVATAAARVVPWLRGEGVSFLRAGPQDYQSYALSPPRRNTTRLDWKGRAGDVLLRNLRANLLRRGGQMLFGSRARHFLMDSGRCQGVSYEKDGRLQELRARATILSSGGFECNREMLRRYVTRWPDKLVQRNSGAGRGDGLRMAEEVGAELVNMDFFYGHLLSRDALHNDDLWPQPTLDSLAVAGMLIGSDGMKAADQTRGGVSMANAVAKLDDPLSASVIFDQDAWRGKPGTFYVGAPNPHLPRNGATVFWADDLRSLAAMLKVPPDALAASVESHNRSGQTRIARPPFYGVPACAGITYTLGGVHIDERARILSKGGAPIPGLYGAGTVTGGLEGGAVAGYVGGLAQSVILGLTAADCVASELFESTERA